MDRLWEVKVLALSTRGDSLCSVGFACEPTDGNADKVAAEREEDLFAMEESAREIAREMRLSAERKEAAEEAAKRKRQAAAKAAAQKAKEACSRKERKQEPHEK